MVGSEVRGGVQTRVPGWRSDPRSGLVVGPEVGRGGRIRGPHWRLPIGTGTNQTDIAFFANQLTSRQTADLD